MAQTLQRLSMIAFIVSLLCLMVAIFFWFYFKISTVMNDLIGKKVSKLNQKNQQDYEKMEIEETNANNIQQNWEVVTDFNTQTTQLLNKDNEEDTCNLNRVEELNTCSKKTAIIEEVI